MPIVDELTPGARRRFFIGMAVDRYRDLPEENGLVWPTVDVERLTGVFVSAGYRQALPGMGNYWTVDHVRSSLSGWSKDVGLGSDDVVVFYFAGHGLVADRDRHYLMCWNSEADDPAATALATEDLVRILTRTGLRNLLLVLDTCYGGTAAADGAQVTLRTIARQFTSADSAGVWLLSSARAKDEAIDGAFVDALLPALRDVGERSGQRQRHLDLVHVVDAVNRRFLRSGLRQRAELAAGMVTGLAPFLDNEGYRPGLPAGDMDLELQRLLSKRDLRDHFGPRSRGVERDSEPGLYFHGRDRLLDEIVAWLTADQADDKGRVVTGSPGCGKSAVLGRIVAMSDPSYRRKLLREPEPAGVEVPPRLVDVGVHARHKLLPEIVQQIASGFGLEVDGPGQLLRELSVRGRQGEPSVIVVDALDEAGSGTAADAGGRGEPRRIAREFLRPLSEVPGVKLLVGTRRELVGSLGMSMQVLNLDDPKYLGQDDIAGYVTNLLLARNEPEVSTPYRGNVDLAHEVGLAVAGRAAGVFLVARMTARGLRSMGTPVDVTEPGWQNRLPSEIGQAFEDYLSWFGSDESRVRALLTPLAFAEGQGLPRGALWTGISTVLGNRPFNEDDVDWLLEKAAAYVAEVTDHDRSVYRLYHQALAEHLRDRYREGSKAAQNRIVDAVLSTIPRDSEGKRDWFVAHRYVQANLATHAAAAGRLDELVGDPSFLLVAEQLALLRAFRRVRSQQARQARNAYEQVAHQLMASAPLGERAAYLQLSARRCCAGELAEQIDQLGISMPWRTRWAWWSPTGVHRQLVGHEKAIRSLATADMDGRPVVLTGSADGTARLWDLITQRSIGEPLHPGSKSITALAVGEMGDYTIAVIGGGDGRLRVWDLSSGRPLGGSLDGHTNGITSIVLGEWAGRTLAVTASRDGTARVWDLHTGAQVAQPFTGHHRPVNAVAWTDSDSRRLVLTGGDDHRVRVWDIETSQAVGGSLIGHTEPVTTVALARFADRTMVVTGSKDGKVGLWDLGTRQQVGEPLAAHQYGVTSVGVGELDGVPIAVSCGQTLARVWNLSHRHQIGQPLAGHDGYVNAVAIGSVDHRPVAITGGTDATARIWDLTADQPLTGHAGDVVSVAMGRVNGRCLALTGGEDATAVLWDLDLAGTQNGPPLSGHRATVSAVALGEIGRRSVAVTGDEDATVLVWDLATRQCIGEPLIGHTGPVSAMHLCQVDGDHVLATGSKDGTVRLWEPAAGTVLQAPLTGHNADVDLLAVVEVNGRVLVLAGARAGHVTVWDLRSRQRLSIEQPDLDQWGAVAVGNVDSRVAALFAGNDNKLLLWDLIGGRAMGVPMVGHTEAIEAAVLGERGGRPLAVTGSRDGVVIAWDLRAGKPLGPSLVSTQYPRLVLAMGPVAGDTAAITVGEQVRLWSLTTFYQLGDALHGRVNDIFSLASGSIDGRQILVAAGEDGTVRVLGRASGQLDGPVLNGHARYIGGAAFGESDGPVAVTIGQLDSAVRVWDLTAHRQRSQWAHQESVRRVYSDVRLLAMSRRHDKPIVASAAGSRIQIWNLASQGLVAELAGHTGRIRAVSAAELNGVPILLSASIDSTARLWDLDACAQLGPALAGHDGAANAVTLSATDDDVLVFTGDSVGVVRAWDPASGNKVGTTVPRLQKWVSCLAAGRLYGRPVLVIGSGDGTIRIWCRTAAKVVLEAQLNTTPQDVIVNPPEELGIATAKGVVTLHIQDWTKGGGR